MNKIEGIDTPVAKCQCCGIEISYNQAVFSGLCPTCDTGRCRNPEAYHELERENKRLRNLLTNTKDE